MHCQAIQVQVAISRELRIRFRESFCGVDLSYVDMKCRLIDFEYCYYSLDAIGGMSIENRLAPCSKYHSERCCRYLDGSASIF